MGWPLQAKESCYLFWELLSEEHQAALQHTPSIQALRYEDFKEEIGQSATRGLSGMVIWATTTQGPAGACLTPEYRQGMTETTREFAERTRLHFIQDLGTSWDQWPRTQRWNLIRKFLGGIHQERYDRLGIYGDEEYLADLSWSELLSGVSWADQSTPQRCHSPWNQTELGPTGDQPQQAVFALNQLPMTLPYQPDPQQQPTPDWLPPYQTPPMHHAHPKIGNHFIHPTWEQRPPRPRRRRRKRAQGNAPGTPTPRRGSGLT